MITAGFVVSVPNVSQFFRFDTDTVVDDFKVNPFSPMFDVDNDLLIASGVFEGIGK